MRPKKNSGHNSFHFYRESIISTDKTGNSVKESVLKLIVQSLFDSLNEASKEATLNHSDGETSFAYKMYMECADILEDELFELTPGKFSPYCTGK